MDKQLAAKTLETMQWDVQLMMALRPEQRRAIGEAVKTLGENPLLDALRGLLPPGHPMAR